MSQQYYHAIVISVVRGLAALQVAMAHLRAQFYPGLSTLDDPTLWYQGLSFLTGFAHLAVIVFFLLSGWLVGGSLLNKLHRPRVFVDYALDRLTRLWIVLIPAFLLSLALGAAEGAIATGSADWSATNEFSGTAFVGNLLGLQGMLVPRFGGNFALWSLANEVWYYLLFPLLVLGCVARTQGRRAAALLTMLAIGSLLAPDIQLYFFLWLLGVLFSRVRLHASQGVIWLLAALCAAVAVWARLLGSEDSTLRGSLLHDLVFSLAFLVFLCSLQQRANLARRDVAWLARWGERLAAFSFTLYVVHVPLLLFAKTKLAPGLDKGRLSPDDPSSLLVYALLLGAVVLAAWLFHLPFEAQTGRLRLLLRRLGARQAVLPAP
ncbi:acyltransferase [Massilia sp. PAMC28688]|uniref:acyltransferase family protein n=1 Tax=Massilia sp. PAMC28688 TaxID=2861283 RepID=UPI001C6381AF|nr:acyltransferase [Massilia sp. PAMC28688]QYF92786.1 acyltransferase [Massilia sp. PAMC28688]